jgi:hypothetical protein
MRYAGNMFERDSRRGFRWEEELPIFGVRSLVYSGFKPIMERHSSLSAW